MQHTVVVTTNTRTMTKINWKYCQNNSDLILASGLKLLTKKTKTTFDNNYPSEYGNYLISDKTNKWKYIGEAKSLSNRLKQHSREKTSTFYKNYLRSEKDFYNLPKGLKISDFQISTILTNNRKERNRRIWDSKYSSKFE